jgi:beta-glucosidase
VEADVKNSGPFAGDEVAELYLRPPLTAISPKLALAGFERVHLNPGETGHVAFRLDPRALSQVDEKGVRAVVRGRYQVSLGGSQPDGDAAQGVRSREFTIAGTEQIPR